MGRACFPGVRTRLAADPGQRPWRAPRWSNGLMLQTDALREHAVLVHGDHLAERRGRQALCCRPAPGSCGWSSGLSRRDRSSFMSTPDRWSAPRFLGPAFPPTQAPIRPSFGTAFTGKGPLAMPASSMSRWTDRADDSSASWMPPRSSTLEPMARPRPVVADLLRPPSVRRRGRSLWPRARLPQARERDPRSVDDPRWAIGEAVHVVG